MSIELKTSITREEAEFIKSAENIAINTRFGLEKAWWRSGRSIDGRFKKAVVSKNKKGRVYILRSNNSRQDGTRSTRRFKHRASAPGQTPASRPPAAGGGEYRKGFGFNVRNERELVVGNSAPHALWLEEGTLKMRARPGLGNAIQSSQRDILRNLSGEIEDAL